MSLKCEIGAWQLWRSPSVFRCTMTTFHLNEGAQQRTRAMISVENSLVSSWACKILASLGLAKMRFSSCWSSSDPFGVLAQQRTYGYVPAGLFPLGAGRFASSRTSFTGKTSLRGNAQQSVMRRAEAVVEDVPPPPFQPSEQSCSLRMKPTRATQQHVSLNMTLHLVLKLRKSPRLEQLFIT